jgi:hypothetical protein
VSVLSVEISHIGVPPAMVDSMNPGGAVGIVAAAASLGNGA